MITTDKNKNNAQQTRKTPRDMRTAGREKTTTARTCRTLPFASHSSAYSRLTLGSDEARERLLERLADRDYAADGRASVCGSCWHTSVCGETRVLSRSLGTPRIAFASLWGPRHTSPFGCRP